MHRFRHSTGSLVLLAGLASALLSIAVTFPLVRHLSTGVPRDLGDPLLSISILWWNAHVVPLSQAWWNGLWFFPDTGALAFSDHRLGASLIASPLQWAGAGAVWAYNVTLIASFALTATSAFALALALTRRADAAAICGLAFGFNPYRIAHLEHLELLLAFGMPLALLALHRYDETRRPRWLAALFAALLVQGLGSSYYLLFFSVFMALWVAWFLRWRDWRALVGIALASLSAVALLAPIYLKFWNIHRYYGFRRSPVEMDYFSADLSSLVTASPLSALWGWTSGLNGSEKQTFPGLAIVVIAIAGAVIAIHARPLFRDAISRASRWCGALAVMVLLVAVAAQVWGPFRLALGPVRLQVGVLFKPLSIALLFAVAALGLSVRMRDAYKRRSRLAFYGLAAAVLFLCSLGFRPRFLGEVFLYRPPYAWLMSLPGFSDSIRAPARFTMPAVLALSVAGSLAFIHLRLSRRLAPAVLTVCLVAVAADGWPGSLPIHEAPLPWDAAIDSDITAVMELPLGGAEYDAAAMYRATRHGRPTVNGMSGYMPPRYRVLARAFAEHDVDVLDAVGSSGPVLIAVDKREEDRGGWEALVRSRPGAHAAGEDERWRFFRFETRIHERPACGGRVVVPTAAVDGVGASDFARLTDGDPTTFWGMDAQQKPSEVLTVDLGSTVGLCAVGLLLGPLADQYPSHVRVELSQDGTSWQPAFDGPTSLLAFRAAAANPSDARLELTLEPGDARFVRLHLVPARATEHWLLAGLYMKAQ